MLTTRSKIGRYLTLIVLLLLPPAGGSAQERELLSGHRTTQGFVDLTYDRLPNSNVSLEAADQSYEPVDKDGIELWEYKGGIYYHPRNLCFRCYTFLGAYHRTGDEKYLRRAEHYVGRLLSLCIRVDSSAFLPMQFTFAVHGDSTICFQPPWFSGMPQGEFLGVLVRLWELGGKQQYLDHAHEVFNSLLCAGDDGKPWVSRLDSAGYYWIEEYPHAQRPGQTLNGYIAAVFGVYDYYRVTKDSTARIVYDMALTTLKHYLPEYRRPGQSSYYCLGHKQPAPPDYHGLHISMMHHLKRMTGDPFFAAMAETFERDLAPER